MFGDHKIIIRKVGVGARSLAVEFCLGDIMHTGKAVMSGATIAGLEIEPDDKVEVVIMRESASAPSCVLVLVATVLNDLVDALENKPAYVPEGIDIAKEALAKVKHLI